MTAWIIEPREPLIVRDGRPFDLQPGVIAATLPFPFPSTTAGAARSRAGSSGGVFNAQGNLSALKSIQIRGPLLAELDGEQENLLIHAPGDALLLEGKEPLRCKQLVPLRRFADSLISPMKDANGHELAPVGQEMYEAEKQAKKLPAFWYWEKFAQWLLEPEKINQNLSRDMLGILPLPQEQRVHVSLEPGMMVAREGALFETRGLEFTTDPTELARPLLSQTRRLALWLDVDDGHHAYHVQEGLDSLGGERRLVKWQQSKLHLKNFTIQRDNLSEHIEEAGFCRLILLTPAYFKQGYLPNLANWEYKGVKPELRAVLVQRPQVVSGWDMAKGGIKPTRRLAPAGSVFFLALTGQRENRRDWIKHIWMNCVSEPDDGDHNNQNSSDGFGLAVLGTWDGELKEMQIKGDK